MKASLKFISALLLVSLLFALLSVGVSAASVSYEDPTWNEEIMEEESAPQFRLSKQGARVILVVLSVVFGLIFPAAPLTVFTVKLIKKRREVEIIDYIILAISVLWLASGILIFALLL